MPLKFRKIRFNLYFRTFNLSSNAASILWGIFIRQRVRSRDDYLVMKVAIYQRKRIWGRFGKF
ncbi:hypothetical protein ACB092_03G043600 [Castanea dentata]